MAKHRLEAQFLSTYAYFFPLWEKLLALYHAIIDFVLACSCFLSILEVEKKNSSLFHIYIKLYCIVMTMQYIKYIKTQCGELFPGVQDFFSSIGGLLKSETYLCDLL